MKKIVFSAILLPLCILTTAQIPVITLVSPSSVDRINNSGLTFVKAEIVSNSPLQKFRIINDGVTIVNEKDMIPEKKDNVTYIIGTKAPLKKGLNTVYVEAKNSFGWAISEKRIITSQFEPFITWFFPGADKTNIESGIVNIKVEIKSDYELQNLSININGTESADQMIGITSRNNGTYVFEKLIQLTPGENNVYLTAANAKGVTTSVTRIINFGFIPKNLNKNAIYGTLGLGPIYGTLIGNYEHSVYQPDDRFFSSIRARIGVGPWILWESGGIHYIATVQALSGKRKGHLEIGAGAVLIQNFTYNFSSVYSSKLWPAGNLGYRYQKLENSGGVFRIGIGFPETLYLSLGFCF
ncbi:MAG: hypothetical protein A2Y71_06395 [Bacteroidetes bacterium RBG_13_42_15]|nr:MAG: hypothetical protein A2Y71_06395 [Bacteroidetes bacterium RBG_13_42_15]